MSEVKVLRDIEKQPTDRLLKEWEEIYFLTLYEPKNKTAKVYLAEIENILTLRGISYQVMRYGLR